jgi:hypothetical protein
VVRDGIAHRIAIGTGREFQDGVEVRSGLNGGELVIVEPPDVSRTFKDVRLINIYRCPLDRGHQVSGGHVGIISLVWIEDCDNKIFPPARSPAF